MQDDGLDECQKEALRAGLRKWPNHVILPFRGKYPAIYQDLVEMFGDLDKRSLIPEILDCSERWTWMLGSSLHVLFRDAEDAVQCKMIFG